MSVDGLLFSALIPEWKKAGFKCVRYVSSTFDITQDEDLQERKDPSLS